MAVNLSDHFCEACGADLPFAPAEPVTSAESNACTACGGTVSSDGYCEQCGLKQPEAHDHEEVDLGWLAGVTDRGVHHPRNEDAMGIAAPRPGLAIAVVCDGVSSSSNAEAASAAAVRSAAAVLLSEAGRDAKSALLHAASAAQAEVVALPKLDDGVAPSCTFVAAVLHDSELTVGWLGDSRAYWLSGHGNQRLTTDDSWAAEQVAAGALNERDAEADPQAHAITRWLGADASDTTPRTAHFSLTGPGRIVVCSDGLWNYCSDADELSALASSVPSTSNGAPTPLALAQFLTNFARDAGGHDNITVVVIEAPQTGAHP